MNRIVTRTVTLLSGALVAACSGGDGASRGDPATQPTELPRKSTAFHIGGNPQPGPRPPLNQLETPPPPSAFPTPIACPAGTTCTFTPLWFGPPITTCTNPWWFVESGATASAKHVMACSYTDHGIPMLDTWISEVNTSPGFGAAISTSLPGLPAAAAGVVYVTFLPPTPTVYPDPATGQPTTLGHPTSPSSWAVDPSGAPLPCTQIYGFASPPLTFHELVWGAFCVDTPAVEAWTAIAHTDYFAGPGIPYGYAYVSKYTSETDTIGGSCSTGCTGPVGDPAYPPAHVDLN